MKPYVSPDFPEWGDYILQGLREAAEKAVAEHIREGRGEQIRAMQETVARYYASHAKPA